jgi:acyl transferase domain-containing protein
MGYKLNAKQLGGVRLDEITGSDTGVFVGSFCKDWSEIASRDPDNIPMYHATGTGQALLANRLSYFYNLSGPSIAMDTACSSSLVALHLACESLRRGESQAAMVGGVNCILNIDMMISMSSMRFLSEEGRSYAFDNRGSGYGRGEGVGVVFLKPLALALRDGNPVRAVIRNSGVNQDGRTPGITFPSARAQAALIRKVYSDAGLDPTESSYAEAHGTGTQAGDPIEMSALYESFRSGNRTTPMLVGSVKTNVGHLEASETLFQLDFHS